MNFKLKERRLFQSHRECYLPAVRFFTKKASSSILLARISRFVNKTLYRFGLGSALNRYENCITFYSSHADTKLYDNYSDGAIFCNFGSGAFFHKKWKNYDYPGQSRYYQAIQGHEGKDFFGIDLCADNLALPEEDNSVSLIYCSHTLEHLDEVFARKFIVECLRILKPHGIMRVALPNTSNVFELIRLFSEQENLNPDVIETFRLEAASHVLADIENVLSNNEIEELFVKSQHNARNFYRNAVSTGVSSRFSKENPARHISFWDYEELVHVSKEAGFSFCFPFYQGSSLAEPFTNLNVFDNTEPHISFYAELMK
jgi:predicted SAM-dependent methyltransferase